MSLGDRPPLLDGQGGGNGREGFGLDEPSHGHAMALRRHSLLVDQSHGSPLAWWHQHLEAILRRRPVGQERNSLFTAR